MKLYLIRHAQSEANVRKELDTALPGPPLTELGQEQAVALAGKLGTEPIAAVYASLATRAQQTAAPLAAALGQEVRTLEGVHEINVGDLEGRADHEAIMQFVGVTHRWMQGDEDAALPGGESGVQVRTRYLEAIGSLRAAHEGVDDVIALVSHGGAIRFGSEWLASNVRPELADSGLVPNTGVVELETVDGGGWRCLSWVGTPI